MEKDFADFTYVDSARALTKLLRESGLEAGESWLLDLGKPITYHLEVKATTEQCSEPFYMSNNQVDKVCRQKKDDCLRC
jgi:hypothetical protein